MALQIDHVGGNGEIREKQPVMASDKKKLKKKCFVLKLF
jgi:hypothetical protein